MSKLQQFWTVKKIRECKRVSLEEKGEDGDSGKRNGVETDDADAVEMKVVTKRLGQ